MSTWLSLLAGAVLGAFASLAVAVYLQDRWKASSDRRRRLRRTKAIGRAWTESDGPITIAGIPTSMHLIEGDGFLVIEPQNVRVDIRSTRAELPALVVMAREKVAKQLATSRRNEDHSVSSWNSANMIALTGYHISRTAEREDATVHLKACLNDYATFSATVLRLDEEIDKPDAHGGRVSTTLRREFLPTPAVVIESVRRPLPFLANGVGVALLAFTDDDKVLLVHRLLESRARPGECDVTVVEGIDGVADVLDAEPQRGAAWGQVAVDRPGNGHGCRGVGVPPAGCGQAGQCRVVALVAAGPGGHVRGRGQSRSRLSLLHRRSASTRFSMASMPQRIRGMK